MLLPVTFLLVFNELKRARGQNQGLSLVVTDRRPLSRSWVSCHHFKIIFSKDERIKRLAEILTKHSTATTKNLNDFIFNENANWNLKTVCVCMTGEERESVCVREKERLCVCVCEWERERMSFLLANSSDTLLASSDEHINHFSFKMRQQETKIIYEK